jgi:hypothetical protein
MEHSAIELHTTRDLTPREALMSLQLLQADLDAMRDRIAELEGDVAWLRNEVRLARFCDER